MTWLLLSLALAAEPEAADLPQLTPRLDVFSEYAATWPTGAAASNTFSVPRAHVGLDAEWHGAKAGVLVEGAYATQGGALIGVAGDSVVVRLREAWGGGQWRWLEGKLGLVPTLTVPEVERAFRYRELAADALETWKWKSPADFGASLKATLPEGYGWVGVQVVNGEGYTQRELNPGKNLEATVSVHPLPAGVAAPLSVLGSAMVGSTGAAQVPTQRLGGGLLWGGEAFGAGATMFWASGLEGDGTRKGLLGQVFARAELFEHLLLAAKVTVLERQLGSTDSVVDLVGAVGGRYRFLEGFVAVQRTLLSGAAVAALPGEDATQLRFILRVRWPDASPLVSRP
jgi:hypothetical protein